MRQFNIARNFNSLFIVFLLSVLAACSNGDSSESIKSPDLPPGELISINVVCMPGMLNVGETGSCTAEGVFRSVVEENGEFVERDVTADITGQVRWRSSNPGVATIDQNGDYVAVGGGTTNMIASLDGESGSDDVRVFTSTLTAIAVQCNPDVILVGATTQCRATGTFVSDEPGSTPQTLDITTTVTWTESDPNIGTVDDAGVVTGVGAGVVTITASSDGVSGSDQVTVRTLNVTALDVTPDGESTIQPFCFLQYTATATFEDGSTADVTANANTQWSSDSTDTTVDGDGTAFGGPPGTPVATITASFTDAAGNTETDSETLGLEDGVTVSSLCVEATENADLTS
ncbi:MAG: Ig-like domain-containing protein, partial [Salinisphaeraceae bacterium]|nr:Ig-like domain-containing protein [Salinisphaeraceae bacterium]